MISCFLRELRSAAAACALNRSANAEYSPHRAALRQAGLTETSLRRMDPDARVAVLEQAKLDPYDYIYLAC